MFGLFKSKKPTEAEADSIKATETHSSGPAESNRSETAETKPTEKKGLFARLTSGLARTRKAFTSGLASLLLGKKEIDATTLEELETLLISADVGVEATSAIIADIQQRLDRKQLADTDGLYRALRENMVGLLAHCSKPLEIDTTKKPYVILMVGVNGVGKTTTIGKLAQRYTQEGRSVMLAAGDTFRAAAVEQLQVWGERNKVPVISQHSGADSAAVIFDAVQAAKARGIDVLIADTAGRLHTQNNLMVELQKIKRVMAKLDAEIPHEIMLVLDASTGQNALSQATLFTKAVQLTGITLTKLDGTAKGGIIFAIAKKLNIPIRFIGVGETVDDLRVFNAHDFVDALLARENGDPASAERA